MAMSLFYKPLLLAGALVTTVSPASAQQQVPEFARHYLDEARSSYIFVFKDHVPRANVGAMSGTLLNIHGGSPRYLFTHAIKGFSANISSEAAARLAANNPNIAYYEANGVAWGFPKPPWAGGGGDDSEAASQQIPYGITRVGGARDGSGLHAWVIDTGIDLDHPDLNVGSGANFVKRGKNTADDGNGHGTHVAGTIGAIDNNRDVVGVAAGATVHPVRVLDNSGSGTIDGVVAGVDWVAANGASGDCANMSLGASGSFSSLEDAVKNAASKGIRFALAAGNDNADASGYSPARVDGSNIFTVSAIDNQDYFASFSNYGNPPVDFAAPGVSILSTKKGGGTTTLSGTSMATPHVCGLLLFGTPNSDGSAKLDPDGTPDPIAHN